MKPVRLTPSLRERVWGRTALAPWFPDSKTPIGEAWYLADRDLPLLVKMLFTSGRLSVQVHPDDGEDGPRGKTEMWHIVDAEPGATIALGFREPVTRERLWDAVRTGEIEHLVNWIPVKAGETYLTPAHTVHAIGAGIVLFEIQQNSDVTYRLWDYGRPRELHLEKAVPIADLGVHPGAAALPVRSRHFVTELVELNPGDSYRPTSKPCQLLVAVAGQGSIAGEPLVRGEVWLLPEGAEPPSISAGSPVRLLRSFVPPLE